MSMMVAAKIYLLNKEKSLDSSLKLLKILRLSQGTDIDEVIAYYKKLLNREFTVAEVVSSTELSAKQKSIIKEKISNKFNEKLTFVFNKDESILGGLLIKVNDSVIDETIKSKINDIS